MYVRHDKRMKTALTAMRLPQRAVALTTCLTAGLVLSACSSAPPRSDMPSAAQNTASTTASPAATRSLDGQIAPTSDTRAAIAAYALQQVDAPYQANAVGPDRFDNSGYIYYAYRGAGAALPRATQGQLDAGKPIDLAEAQPADLLFFRVDDATGSDHLLVGLYTDTGEMLMAVPNVGGESGVTLLDLDDEFWAQRMVGVIRVLNP